MKNISFFILFVISSSLHSQKYKIDYSLFANEIIDIQVSSSLYFDTNFTTSYYVVNPGKTNLLSKRSDEDITTYNLLKSKRIIINKYSSENNSFLSLSKIGTKPFLVTDELPTIEWSITNESKYIKEYKCFKAIGFFRGRKWEAWFTMFFPINVGPSKFQGLPGLIIEMNDESGKFLMQLERIASFNFNAEDLETAFLDQFSDSYKQVTLQEFVNLEKEYFDSVVSETIGRDNVTKISTPRSGMELIYEWEEEVKKE